MTMRLTGLRVEQLRQFRRPFELTGFEPGLNIFSGPNEAGKSTLVRAIRAAFFERHRSTAVEDLRPWGDGSAAPAVELNFALADQPYQLSKSFLNKKRCALRMGAQTLEGTEAEDHLAKLFGFAFAGRGASQSEHWGIPGLLWVEQGTGQELHDAARHAREHLHDALEGQMNQHVAGAMAATGGDELLAQLRAQRDELLTQGGKPRAAYAEAIEQAQILAKEIGELDVQISNYRQQVDQLAALRAQHQLDEREQPWDALRTELQAAEQRQQALQHSERQLSDDRSRHAQLEQHRSLLLDQLASFARQVEDAKYRQEALRSSAEQLQAAEATLAAARERAEQAKDQSQTAREALRLARQEASRHSLTAQLQETTDVASRLEQALGRAEEEQERLTTLQQQAATSAISKAEVGALRELDRRLREVTLQRQAVATRLRYVLLGGQTLSLRGNDATHILVGQGEQLLAESATLQIDGVGELTITPGGHDLDELARAHAAAQDELQAALQRIGLTDVAQAESRLSRHTDVQAQIQLAEQALGLTAPQGLEQLRQSVVQAKARIQASLDALSQLPAEPASPVLPLAQAEANQEAANATEDAALAALSQTRQQQVAAESRHNDARRELATAQEALAAPARQQRQLEAQQRLLETSADRDALAARIEKLSGDLRLARPDIVVQDIQRLNRSVEQLERSHQQRREQILLLENTLQQAGAQGLEEKRGTAAGELSRAQRRQTELQRRAAALDLLCQKLDAKRQATLARLQAPLQQHLERYLHLLFPAASLQIDDQLAPGTLTRRDAAGAVEAGEFAALSFGAREQLGLISRFAYADLLREAGRPTLLILDDALVHSDQVRLPQMKRVIFDAAQRHQVLLFTCHPEVWRDMGVTVRELAK